VVTSKGDKGILKSHFDPVNQRDETFT